MTLSGFPKLALAAALSAGVLSFPVSAADFTLRISTENSETHSQTRGVQRFVDVLRNRVGDQMDIEFYPEAMLFRDRDIVPALVSGRVDMAVPGNWQLDRFVPDMGLYMLPIFYAQPVSTHYAVRDGELGQQVNQSIETELGVKVIGRWLDLGYGNLYFLDKQVSEPEDLSRLRVRVPGGLANTARIENLGAIASVVAWPDLPNALDEKRVDGVLTTHESVRSAALWENGLKYIFEDQQYFPQYVPIISNQFWERLPEPLQQAVLESWDEVVDESRLDAGESQLRAKQILLTEGMELVTPSESTINELRSRAMGDMDQLVDDMGIDPALVERARELLPQ